QDPSFSTAVGLLLYGLQQQNSAQPFVLNRGLPSMWTRMRSWFQGNF
ncbi:MAG: cell division protein FtsA, partial [Gammaproteobacteria bacterium]|nr:cell division protein FtsA [Gammaproteobacteria bacterium]